VTTTEKEHPGKTKSGLPESLARRQRVPEVMDQPELDASAHSAALRGLGRINRLSLSASIIWPSIADLAKHLRGRSIRMLDLASGGGDVPINLAKRARRASLNLAIEGCDVSPVAVAFAARGASRAGVSVRFFRLDALNDSLPEGFDVVTCSLFLHHLSEVDAVSLLRKMADAAGSMILVNDLLRSRTGYWLAWTGCRLLSRSSVVRHDGPASVQSAFSLTEARQLAERAGLINPRVERRWPQRFLLSWSRQHS
jgi:2-polyprenyl-3-methyl-5-hydroxy-6-metoxy-1,4-benzoquinol methylase